jgi:hypothetical protein
MSKHHEAILIDPVDRSISIVPKQSEDLEAIYKILKCDCVCSFKLPFNHIMFLDDNGLIRPVEEVNKRGLFYVSSYSKPLAGRGLIFHGKADGSLGDAFLLIEQIEELVRWRPKGSKMTKKEQQIATELEIVPFKGIKDPNE